MFNQLSNNIIITKIIRFFLYKKDSELDVLYTSAPKSIPQIVKLIYKNTNDYKYLDICNKITSKLTSSEQKLIHDKFQTITVDSIKKLPYQYPYFSLRNVYVENC